MVLQTIISLVALASAIWVIYDVLVNNKKYGTLGKVAWIVAALLFSIITAIVYYLMEKR